MGWCGSMSHGFVRGERIRHVAWRAAEDSNRRQAGAVHGDRLHVVNPAQQITNLFYDILYYDNFKPFFTTAGILAAMSLVCLAAATVLLRRQRYEYL